MPDELPLSLDAAATVDLFVELSAALSAERSLPSLLGRILSAALRLTGAHDGRIYGLDVTKQNLLPLAQGPDGQAGPVAIYLGGAPNLTNPYAYAAAMGRILKVPDIYAYSGFDFTDEHARDRRRGQRTGAIMAMPLRDHEGVTVGVLHVADMPDGLLPDRLLSAFASQAAVTLSNRRLIDQNQSLIAALGRRNQELDVENQRLRHAIAGTTAQSGIVGDSPALRASLSLVRKVASTRVTVLILGETGTGKEVFASAIHRASPRANGPFVAQNCAALPENLLESELFGYRRGAFTGAVTDKQGLVQSAHNGTLFLDEIGDMPLALQAKLLRLLQENEVRAVGATRAERVDVRVVAATNVDLKDRIARGEFREDLFYRLNVFPIRLPPLRERTEDIPRLAEHFLVEAARQHGRLSPGLTPDAMEALIRYAFPGNVRELRNIIERALLLCDEGQRIGLDLFPAELRQALSAGVTGPVVPEGPLKDAVERFEAWMIAARLQETGGNQTVAASLLGISRRSLVEKLGRYGFAGRRSVPARPHRQP
ncbi:MAG: sigma 54-interacting transcriptional regulator [Niveispirillum sp.]|uniref:sigma 54-interacting transcriptional regulator n=1 Tax=Niveispirillum sp. TaxID=1917217 RepID=UPI003BA6D693